MKLYSWIQNEGGISKTQGGNKAIEFTLEYEEGGQDWRCNPSNHELHLKYMLDENGKPTIYIWGNKEFKVVDNRAER